jgi:hypothetical protein
LETVDTKGRPNQNALSHNFTPLLLNLSVEAGLLVHAHAMPRLLFDLGAVQLSQIYQVLFTNFFPAYSGTSLSKEYLTMGQNSQCVPKWYSALPGPCL